MSEPFKLFRLQQTDTQLDHANSRLVEIERILNNKEQLNLADLEVTKSSGEMAEAQKEVNRAEEDVKAQQIKIEQNQSILYGGTVTNPKELQDLQLEADALRRQLAVLEDTQLEKMVTLEDREGNLSSREIHLTNLQAQIAQENSELNKEKAVLLHDVENLERERQASIPGIPAEDLALYDKIRARRAGVAVSKIENKACAGCGAEVPHAKAQEARSPKKIVLCDTCGRILYGG